MSAPSKAYKVVKADPDCISVSVVDPLMGPDGWHFSTRDGCIPDAVNQYTHVRELYLKTEGYSGRYTVPILWDKERSVIVNNESSEIIRMLYTEFDAWSSAPGLTYYPEALRSEIDRLNEMVYEPINNGVYKSGFATTQDAYMEAVTALFAALDGIEAILNNQDWLAGSQFTEADLRLFPTIVRFDAVYHGHFKCNLKTISHDYPYILKWARKIYQMPGVAETVHLGHIKEHYYKSHAQINPSGVIPVWNGPDFSAPI